MNKKQYFKLHLYTDRHNPCTQKWSTQQTSHQYAFERILLQDLGGKLASIKDKQGLTSA